MKKNYFRTSIVIAVSLLTMSSCLDSESNNVDDLYYSELAKEAFAANVSEPVFTTVDQLISSFGTSTSSQIISKQKIASGVPAEFVTLLSEVGVYPKDYLIDFGTEGYTNENGVIFKGHVYLSVLDKASQKKVYTFDSLYVNDNFVVGSREIEVISHGVLRVITAENIVYKNADTSIRTSERTRKLVDNNGTTDIYTDDSFEITGKTTGINTKGEEYSMVISTALLSVPDWKYFVKGTAVTTTVKGTQIVDFGNGELDDIATRKINDGAERAYTLNW